MIYPEAHLLVGKLVPVVTVDSLGGSCIGIHKPGPTQGHRKNLHNEVAQRHEQFTRVAFGAPPGNKL
jgi:hypothetical protein